MHRVATPWPLIEFQPVEVSFCVAAIDTRGAGLKTARWSQAAQRTPINSPVAQGLPPETP